MYAVDPGLLEAMSLKLTEDRGAVLETMVFMSLRRQGCELEYFMSSAGRAWPRLD